MSDLRIRLVANLDQFRAAMSQAQDSVRSATDRMRANFRGVGDNAVGGAQAAGNGFAGMATKLGGLAAAYAALSSIKALANIADQAALTTARIQGLTGSVEETSRAQSALYEMAQRLQAPYQETANTFARMLPAVQQLGGGVAQTTRLTEVLLTTAKLSGASAAEAAASATQFAQGLASGVLQGDELKSILENNSTLARTLAGALGVTIGELRKMGEQGKLTADVVGNALLGSYEQIKAQSAALPATVGGAWTTITNAFNQFVVTINNGTGTFGALGQVLMEVARVVEAFTLAIKGAGDETQTLEEKKAAQEFAQNVGRSFAYMGDVIGAVVTTTITQLRALFGILQALGDAWGALAAATVAAASGDFSGAAGIMAESMGKAKDAFVAFGEAGYEGVTRNTRAIMGQGPALEAYNKLLADSAQKAREAATAGGEVGGLRSGAGATAATEAELKKAAAARMAAWEEQLQQMRLAHAQQAQEQGTFLEFSRTQEAAFWQEQLAGANITALDRVAIEKRLSALQLGELEARNAAQLAGGLRLIEAERRAAAIRADMAQARALAAVDAEQQEAQARLGSRAITDAQYLQLEQQFEAQRYEIRAQAVRQALELARAEGRDPAEVEQLNAQLLQLELDYQQRRRAIQLEAQAGGGGPLAGLLPDQGTLENTLGTMFDMTQTWGQKMQGIFSQISAAFTRELIVKPLSEMLMRYIRETALYRMLFVQQTTGQAAASATVTAIKAGEATAVVGANAAEAASGAAAAVAPTPFIGPALAVGAFAAIMALVMGARSSIKSARGGYDIPAGLNPVTQLHAEEMVLPAEHANTIRQMSEQGGAGATVNVEVRGESVGGWLLLHKSELAKAIKAAHRGFAFA